MARDPGLEELIRAGSAARAGLTEKSMFGGWAWLLNGNLLCGAREDGMLARLGKGRDGWALALDDDRPDDLARPRHGRLGARRTRGLWRRRAAARGSSARRWRS